MYKEKGNDLSREFKRELTSRRIEALRVALLDDSVTVPLYQWGSDDGGCIDTSDNIAQGLQERGFPVELRMGMGHVSVQDRSIDPEEPIILDGSYLQFFLNGVENGMPLIAIGTASQMETLLDRYSRIGTRALRVQHGAKRFVDRVYRNAHPFVPPANTAQFPIPLTIPKYAIAPSL